MGEGQKQEGRFDHGRKEEAQDVSIRNRAYPCRPKSTMGEVEAPAEKACVSSRHPRTTDRGMHKYRYTWKSGIGYWSNREIGFEQPLLPGVLFADLLTGEVHRVSSVHKAQEPTACIQLCLMMWCRHSSLTCYRRVNWRRCKRSMTFNRTNRCCEVRRL